MRAQDHAEQESGQNALTARFRQRWRLGIQNGGTLNSIDSELDPLKTLKNAKKEALFQTASCENLLPGELFQFMIACLVSCFFSAF